MLLIHSLGMLGLYLALLGGFGLALHLALDPRPPVQRSGVGLCGESILLGWGGTGLVLVWVSSLGGSLSVGIATVGGLTIGLAALAWRRGAVAAWRQRLAAQRCDATPSGPSGMRRTLRLPAFAALLFLALGALGVVVVHAMGLPLFDWDAVGIWAFKARVLQQHNVRTAPGLLDPALAFTHLDYPLTVSAVLGGAMRLMGETFPDLARGVFPWLALGLGLTLYGDLAPRLGRLPALALVALLGWTPTVLRHAGASTADIPQGAFIVLAVILAGRAVQSRHPGDWALTAVAATITMQIKQEGMPAGVLVLGAAMLLAWRRGGLAHQTNLTRAGLAAVATLICCLPWFYLRHLYQHSYEDYGGNLTRLDHLAAGLNRIPQILGFFRDRLSDPAFFGYTWWLLPLALVLGPAALRRRDTWLVWIVLTGQLAAYTMAYVLTPWDLYELLFSAAHRLLAQVTPLAILLIGHHYASAFGIPPTPNDATPPTSTSTAKTNATA